MFSVAREGDRNSKILKECEDVEGEEGTFNENEAKKRRIERRNPTEKKKRLRENRQKRDSDQRDKTAWVSNKIRQKNMDTKQELETSKEHAGVGRGGTRFT